MVFSGLCASFLADVFALVSRRIPVSCAFPLVPRAISNRTPRLLLVLETKATRFDEKLSYPRPPRVTFGRDASLDVVVRYRARSAERVHDRFWRR
jgi:hypothetical protein